MWKFQHLKKINKKIRVKAAQVTIVKLPIWITAVELGAYFGQEKAFETNMNLNPELARTSGG
jgi:hypothetical protein